MLESDHPDSRFSIDILSLRRFLVRAQREVRLDGEVNVRITSSEEMRRLNREFRRKNEPTDVLSFPSSLNGKSEAAGDIAICAEIAYANAGALGHPLEEELKVLILHGLLHLAGYDHETDQGEMARRERRLRAKLRLPSTLIERTLSAKTRASASAASYVIPAAPGQVFGRKSQTLKIKKAAKHTMAQANTARSEIAVGKGTTLEVAEKRSRPALGKGTTLVVPSKEKKDPNTSLPKAAAQRKRSGKQRSAPLFATRTSGAKAQKIIAEPNGTAKAVPFPEASRNDPHNFSKPPAESGRLSLASSSSLSRAKPAGRRQ